MAIRFLRSQLKNSRRLLLSPNPLALIEPIVSSISFVAVKKEETDNFHPKKNRMRESTESKTKQKKNRKKDKDKVKMFSCWMVALHL